MVYSQKPLTLCILGAIEKAYPLRREVWGYIPSSSEFFGFCPSFSFLFLFLKMRTLYMLVSRPTQKRQEWREGVMDG